MIEPNWQKSTFSGGGNGDCIELAAPATGRIHLRESDEPAQFATTTPTALAALLGALKRQR